MQLYASATSDTWQTGRNVRDLTQRQVCLARRSPHLTHHHTGVDAQTHGQRHPSLRLQADIVLLQGLDDAEPGSHRPLRIVFMGQGIAKIDPQAIAEATGQYGPQSGQLDGALSAVTMSSWL
jgi:hypothetical protein